VKREVEISADTVEEATAVALAELGLSRDEVDITVISEGKSGVFGLGTTRAKVLVSEREGDADDPVGAAGDDDKIETAREIITGLLDALGLETTISVRRSRTELLSGTVFDIDGDDLGILIGRQGQTLAALQYIARLMVSHRLKERLPIHVDVEGYRQRRNEKLEELAERIAGQVKDRHEPYTLRPMSASERRIIHVTLSDYPGVDTESTGDGEGRRVVVLPDEAGSR